MNDLFQFLEKKVLNLPVEASGHAAAVDRFIVYVHLLMVTLFVGWLIYFVYALYRFRKSRQPEADYHGVRSHSTSNYIEIVVAGIEVFLLVGLALPLWAKRASDFPTESKALNIQVMAQQFQWNFRYPGADGMLGRQDEQFRSPTNTFGIDYSDPSSKDDVVPPPGEMVVPVGKPVILHISSLDVIHSFDCHPLRLDQDAIPGLSIPAHFVPSRVGKYTITCAQLCGNSHYAMRGYLTVMTQADYEKWLASVSKAAAPPVSYE